MTRIRRLLVTLAVALAVPWTLPPAAGAAEGTALSLADRVDALVGVHLRRHGIVGATVGVARAGELLALRSYGFANLELEVPAAPETVYQLSSTTKIVAGTLAAMLVEEGRLDPRALAASYLPDLPEGWRGVTVEQLLGHTSGLPDVVEVTDAADARAAQAAISGRALDGPPGERFRYNQTNYMLLQRILETIEGMPYREVAAKRLLVPLGMTRTRWGSARDLVPGRATSYEPGDDGATLRLRQFTFPGYLDTAAGLNSSVPDLLRLLAALDAGTLVRPATRERMWTPTRLADGRPTAYGWGWDVEGEGSHRSVGHEGGGRTTVRYYPAPRLAVVVLVNGWLRPLSPDALAAAIAALVDPEAPSPTALLPGRLLDALDAGGVPAATGLLAAFGREHPGASTEGALNDAGYALLALDRAADAIAVFALATAAYPESANAWDSLGEAELAAGQLDAAESHYRRSLALDPGNANAERTLARIAGERESAAVAAVVEGFFTEYRTMGPLGIPPATDLERLRPRLSRGLQRALAAAARERDAAIGSAPDEKPPYVDGDLFTSNFEGFTAFRVGAAVRDGDAFRVAVDFTWAPAGSGEAPVTWTDTAVVIRERDAYVLDDLVFGAPWPFANHGRLRALLPTAD